MLLLEPEAILKNFDDIHDIMRVFSHIIQGVFKTYRECFCRNNIRHASIYALEISNQYLFIFLREIARDPTGILVRQNPNAEDDLTKVILGHITLFYLDAAILRYTSATFFNLSKADLDQVPPRLVMEMLLKMARMLPELFIRLVRPTAEPFDRTGKYLRLLVRNIKELRSLTRDLTPVNYEDGSILHNLALSIVIERPEDLQFHMEALQVI